MMFNGKSNFIHTIVRLDEFMWPFERHVMSGHGKAQKAKWESAKVPAKVHRETRQQRRAAARKTLKGGDA